MQGAYLVQLGMESRDELAGRVEEIDTGRTARFQSGTELLQFLEESTKEKAKAKSAGQEKGE